jgi:PAS domain S-box-containing protein
MAQSTIQFSTHHFAKNIGLFTDVFCDCCSYNGTLKSIFLGALMDNQQFGQNRSTADTTTRAHAHEEVQKQAPISETTATDGFCTLASSCTHPTLQLRRSEDRYRRLVEVSPDAIFINKENRIVFINAAGIALFGATSAAQLIGQSPLTFFDPDSHPLIRQRIEAVTATGVAAPLLEQLLIRLDGQAVPVEVTATLFLDDDGAPAIQVIVRDITQRKETEATERTQRQLAEAMRDAAAALTSSLDVEKVMAQILTSVTTVMPNDGGSIILLEGDTGRVAYLRGFAPEAVAFFHTYRFPRGILLQTEQESDVSSQIIGDTQRCPQWIALPPTRWIRSSIRIPIKLHGKLSGFLVLDSATPHHFQPTDIEKLEAFAGYAALALENANHVALLEAGVEARTLALQRAKDQVEAILNNSPDGIVLVDSAGVIQQANDALSRILARSAPDCCGDSLLTLVAEEEQPRLAAVLHNALAAQKSEQIDLRARRYNGSYFDAEVRVAPVKDGNLVCTIRDISERKARERQLRFYASLQENVSDAVIAADLELRVQSWNRAAERIYGWRAEEVIGQNVISLLSLAPESSKNLYQQLVTNGYLHDERTHRRKDGSEVHVLISLSPVNDSNGDLAGLVAILHDMTEWRRVQRALDESRYFVDRITEITPNLIYIFDLETQRAVYMNHHLRALGYSAQELVAVDDNWMQQITHPEDLQRFPQLMAEVAMAKDGEVFSHEYRLRHRSGEWRWFLSQDTIFRRNYNGTVTEILGTAVDITERKRAEGALLASEARYRLLAENINDIVIRLSLAGDYLYVSPSSLTLLGYTPEELVGTSGFALVHPDDLQHTQRSIEETLTSRSMYRPVALRYRHKAGHYLWLEILGRIVFDEKRGVPLEFVATMRDITERMQNAERLREQRDFLQLVIDSVPDLITVKDRDGIFHLANRGMAQLYGVMPADLLGKRDDAISNTAIPISANREQDRTVIDGGQPLTMAEVILSNRCYQVTKIPLANPYGVYERVLMIATDITKRKAAEDALTQALVAEKELNELKSRFVSMASHEFRTPLAAIRATAETLSAYRHRLTEEQVTKRLTKIVDHVVYLTSIIDDVLQLTRLQSGATSIELETFDLDALCTLIIDELQSQRSDLHRLTYRCDPALRTVALDKKLMRHIITNLLSNALKYSPGDIPVHLDLARIEHDLVITCRDGGIGIPPADLTYLFQPFHRAANVGNISGTGLGLVIAKESVELQGGTLTVESREGAGSTFTVRIPLSAVVTP